MTCPKCGFHQLDFEDNCPRCHQMELRKARQAAAASPPEVSIPTAPPQRGRGVSKLTVPGISKDRPAPPKARNSSSWFRLARVTGDSEDAVGGALTGATLFFFPALLATANLMLLSSMHTPTQPADPGLLATPVYAIGIVLTVIGLFAYLPLESPGLELRAGCGAVAGFVAAHLAWSMTDTPLDQNAMPIAIAFFGTIGAATLMGLERGRRDLDTAPFDPFSLFIGFLAFCFPLFALPVVYFMIRADHDRARPAAIGMWLGFGAIAIVWWHVASQVVNNPFGH